MARAILLLTLTLGVAAQDPVLSEEDQKMQEMIESIEAESGAESAAEAVTPLSLEDVSYEPQSDSDKVLLRRVLGYWNAAQAGQWNEVHGFFWQPFREQMPVGSYLNQDKANIESFDVRDIRFVNESCAQVVVSYSITHAMMSLSKIRVKQPWHLESGEWSLVADPYENVMGLRPPNVVSTPSPCDFSSLQSAAAKKSKSAGGQTKSDNQ